MIVKGLSLPDFLIPGVGKCGTRSMLAGLQSHPKLFLPTQEGRFFDNARKSVPYGDFKAYAEYFNDAEPGMLLGEKSPGYMFFPRAIHRVHKALPKVKMIVLLRDPVYRAFSHWNMIKRGLSFQEKIDYDMGHIGRERILGDNIINENVLVRGMYVDPLRSLYDKFGRDQIKIVITERFGIDELGTLEEVCDFLDVGHGCTWKRRRNVGGYRVSMGIAIEAWLAEFYKRLNEELFELLGYSIDEWVTPYPAPRKLTKSQ